MELDLGSFASVKKFAKELKTVSKKPLDRLVCNAAVYQPALQTVRMTDQSNSHALISNHRTDKFHF